MIDDPIAKFDSLSHLFHKLIPTYKSRSWRPFIVQFKWDAAIAEQMEKISPRRCQKRRQSYIIPGELYRAKQSIRFGVAKTGHGYRGERGDFCVVAGVKTKTDLTLFYRRVELLGGLHFDTVIIREIEKAMGPINTITIMACGAMIFALKGNSNEKLYAQLKNYYAQ